MYTKDQIALACLSAGIVGDKIKRILELLPDGETPSLPGQPDRLFYSVPEEKILGITEAALEKAGRQITGIVDPDGC